MRGRRAGDLNEILLNYAKNFTHVILFLGNNDLGPWRKTIAVSPLDVAVLLGGFAVSLQRAGVRVAICQLLPRIDVDPALPAEANSLLQNCLPTRFFNVGRSKIYCKQFAGDRVPNETKEEALERASKSRGFHLNRNGRGCGGFFLRIV